MKFYDSAIDLFAGTFAILVALYCIYYVQVRDVKKQIFTLQLMDTAAKKRVTRLKSEAAKLGALLLKTKGEQDKVLLYQKGLDAKLGKLEELKRNKCGNLANAKYQLKNGKNKDFKIAIHIKDRTRYVCESYEKLDREGRLTRGGSWTSSATSSIGR